MKTLILTKVVLACVKGSLGRRVQSPQLSAYVLQRSILLFYQENRLFPEGLSAAVPAVSDWALRNGVILKKLVRASGLIQQHISSCS